MNQRVSHALVLLTTSFVVIRFTFNNSTRAIDLLGEGEPYHLMGESHLGEAELFVSSAIDGRRETVRTTDDENETSGGLLFLFQPACKLDAAVFLAVLIEQDDSVRGL